MYTVPCYSILRWLLPSRFTHRTGEPAGWFCDITQQDGFHFMHNQCWFYTWLGFIALTRTRDAPSPHVILDAAEVQWNDITTPGSQSEASGPAGLPPSCRDWSIQPKSLGVKIQEWKHQINTCHHVPHVTAEEQSYGVMLQSSSKVRNDRRDAFFDQYCCCLDHIFLCKMWCWEEILKKNPF